MMPMMGGGGSMFPQQFPHFQGGHHFPPLERNQPMGGGLN